MRNVPDSVLCRIGATSKTATPCPPLVELGEKGSGWGNDTNEVSALVPSGDALIMLNFSPGTGRFSMLVDNRADPFGSIYIRMA